MNKTFVTFFMFSLAALPAWAASTCETRVDSHQDATTKQRVAYCLTPEAEAPAAPGPELVYYGVSSSKPAEEPQTEEQKREPVYFDKNGVAVSQNYVESKNFPPFENDRLSVQDGLAARQVGKDEADKAASCCEEKLDIALAEAEGKDDEAGRKARQTKPRRFMKEPQPHETTGAAVAQAYSVNDYGVGSADSAAGYGATDLSGYSDPYAAPAGYAQPAAANVPYSAAQPDTAAQQPLVPTGTPQGEIQQAYALENNPLGQQPAANPAASGL